MDTSCSYNSFIKEVETAIERDQLILPSAPDTVIRARQLLDDPDATTDQLARLIATDTALAARILKVANSVIYKTQNGIDNLQQAIARLGQKLIQTLITSHAMMQLFAQNNSSAASPASRLLEDVQSRSIDIARLSYAIARHSQQLSADDALLAGLVHDIGYLPLLQVLGKSDRLDKEDRSIATFLRTCHSKLGGRILRKWKFPNTFIEVAEEHENIARKGCGSADLVDVIIVANQLLQEKNNPQENMLSIRAAVSAFVRLGLSMECCAADFDEHVETASQLLPH